MNHMAAIVIPTASGEVEVQPSELPDDALDIVSILREERVPVRIWTQIAVRGPKFDLGKAPAWRPVARASVTPAPLALHTHTDCRWSTFGSPSSPARRRCSLRRQPMVRGTLAACPVTVAVCPLPSPSSEF